MEGVEEFLVIVLAGKAEETLVRDGVFGAASALWGEVFCGCVLR